LKLILMMSELCTVVSEDGRIIVMENAPEDSVNFRLQQELWDLARNLEARGAEPERDEKKLADFEVHWSGEGRSAGPGDKVSAIEGFTLLREITGLNITINGAEAPFETLEGIQVVLPPSNITALTALSSMADASGLDYISSDDVVLLTTKDMAAKHKEEMENERKVAEERLMKINTILGKVISIGFESAPMCEVTPKLESAIGLPVITDEETWFSNRRVTIAPGNRSVKEVLEEVGSMAGVRWLVEPAAVYLVQK
jgi:hypothetical protein